jgi:hypothetical protein
LYDQVVPLSRVPEGISIRWLAIKFGSSNQIRRALFCRQSHPKSSETSANVRFVSIQVVIQCSGTERAIIRIHRKGGIIRTTWNTT